MEPIMVELTLPIFRDQPSYISNTAASNLIERLRRMTGFEIGQLLKASQSHDGHVGQPPFTAVLS